MKIKSLDKAVTSVINRSGILQNDIQQVCVACLEHTVEHGDFTQSVRLIEGISQKKGVKSTKLQMYFEAMMGAELVYDKETKSNTFQYDEGHTGKDINVAIASSVNWFDFKPEKGDTTKELEAIVKACIGQLDKSIETGKVTLEQRERLVKAFNAEIIALAEAHLAEAA